MFDNRHGRSSLLGITVGLLALAGLAACGGSPNPPVPTGVVTVAGTVSLPAGSGQNLAGLSVSTPLGSYPVSAAGTFEADVFGGARTELSVENSAGDLVLLGITAGKSASMSVTSTAEALLYYLVGGMWLPPEHQDTLRELLEGAPEAAGIADALTQRLEAGGNGLTDSDTALVAALESAHAALLGDAAFRQLTAEAQRHVNTGGSDEPQLAPFAVEGSNIIIEPNGTVQAGVMALHNPAGSGVVAQNHFRRPVKLLVYETGWENADGVLTENDPPTPVEEVDVPATGQLEFFNALLDVVTADSPWSPVLSQKVDLAGHEGASRTHYQLVAVGPSATDATWPIMDDPRFDIFHGHWENIEFEKNTELFLDELLLPLIEVYGIGSLAKLDAAKLASMKARVRLIHDEHLAGLGVLLRNRQAGYVDGLKYVIGELATNGNLRLDMIDMVRDALAESDKNRAVIDAMESRLSSRASASAIAAAVQTVLVSGDVAKIMYDLSSSPAVVDWTAVSAPTLFALTPESARVTRHDASARFTVVPKGETEGTFLYRWSTSGDFGDLSDLLQDGVTIDTDSNEIWYFHNTPNNILDTDVDTISVEVFEVEDGATSIPPNADPVARMAAHVRGDDRDIDPRVELNFGSTPPEATSDGSVYGCAEMYLRFDAVPGATSYTVHARGVGGQGDDRNTNEDFRLRGPNQSAFIDPSATWEGNIIEFGYTPDWHGVCTWKAKDTYTSLQPITFAPRYDRGADQYLVHLFTIMDTPWLTHGDVGVYVEAWYQFLDNATFEVVVTR